MELNPACAAFWRRFLAETGRADDTPLFDCFHFDLTERWANELLVLVLGGQKRATCSSLAALEAQGIGLPEVGSLSMVTDFAGSPACVIETRLVTVLAFKDMTFDICKREGEDDCLESWQAGHRRFFIQEGTQLGYSFSEDMPVVFEDFRVIFPV